MIVANASVGHRTRHCQGTFIDLINCIGTEDDIVVGVVIRNDVQFSTEVDVRPSCLKQLISGKTIWRPAVEIDIAVVLIEEETPYRGLLRAPTFERWCR